MKLAGSILKKISVWVGVVVISQSSVWGQCVLPNANSLEFEDVIPQTSGDLSHPTQMAMLPDGKMFFAEMWSGHVKMYTPGQGVSDLGKIDIYVDFGDGTSDGTRTGMENGFLGIAVDPGYNTNKWIYAFYSRQLPGAKYSAGDNNNWPHEHVLTRFTVTNGQITSPKDIISFPRHEARHAAGGLDIDPVTGNLFISTGDDCHPPSNQAKWGPRQEGIKHLNALWTAGNTNDLRGKVLRINPIEFSDNQDPAMGVGTTYEIPAGNLKEKFSSIWTTQELPLVRPEIYTMGHRNPYHIKFDKSTGWAMIGEVGPDAGADDPTRGMRGHDEFNLITEAGNFGWPFANADKAYVAHDNEAYTKGTTFDLNNLQNLSDLNTGATALPPAIPAFAFYTQDGNQTGNNSGFANGGESAMAGEVYRYDANKPNVRWPSFFNGKYIVADWARSKIFAMELNQNNTLESVEIVKTGIRQIIDMEWADDGSLYVLRYSDGSNYHGAPLTGSLQKLKYNGSHYAPSTCSHYAVPVRKEMVTRSSFSGLKKLFVNIATEKFFDVPEGASSALIYDLTGREIANLNHLFGRKKAAFPKSMGEVNMVFVKFE